MATQQTPVAGTFNALLPFGLNAFNSIATATDPNLKTTQHLQALVATEPGERVMLPEYGVPLLQDMFGAYLDTEISPSVRDQVVSAVSQWEPNIDVDDISVNPSLSSGQNPAAGAVEIDWSPSAIQSPTSQGTQTATIYVGGAVVNQGTS